MGNVKIRDKHLKCFIIEDKEIESLKDGCIYIICQKSDEFCTAMRTAKKNLLKTMDKEQLVFDYDLHVISNPAEIFHEGSLLLDIENGTNVIIPLKTLKSGGKNYMAAEMDTDNIDLCLPNMIMETEKIGKSEMEYAFKQMALSNPDKCNEILSYFIEKTFIHNLGGIVGAISSLYYDNRSFGISPGLGKELPGGDNILSNDCLGSPGISYKDSVSIFKRFVSNCQTLKNLSKRRKLTKDLEIKIEIAEEEIDYVFNTIWGVKKNTNGFRTFFLSQSDKKLKELYDKMLDRDNIAKDSKLFISIEKSIDGIDKNKKNDGKYRVYLKDSNNKVSLHFKHSETCIIYMMYLIDIYKHGKDVNTLNIKNNKDLFCQLYSYVYGECSDASNKFEKLFKPHISGEKRNLRLSDCHEDIRKTLEKNIVEFEENSSPFIIPSENSHLAVMKEKVSIPTDWKDLKLLC